MSHASRSAAAAMVFLFMQVSPAASAGEPVVPSGIEQIIWDNPGGGNWSQPLNWSPANVPDVPDEFAWIQGGGGTYTIELDTSPPLWKMQLNDTTVTLDLNGNSFSFLDPTGLVNEGTIRVNADTSVIDGTCINTATGSIDILGGATLQFPGLWLQNDGSIVVNSNSLNSGTFLRFTESVPVGGSGEIFLARPAPYSQLHTAPGAVLTQQAGHTIRGRGTVHAALENHGLVSADVPGYTLYLATEDKSNSGVMEATGTGELEISGIVLDNTSGTLRANGGNVTLTGVTVQGGTLERTGSSAEYATGAVTLDGVAHTGYYRITGGTTTTVMGPVFQNEGEIEVNYSAINAGTYLHFADSTTLQGDGVVEMVRPAPYSQITAAPGALVTQAAGHTIHGRGTIHAALENHSLVSADVIGYTLFLATEDKVNRGIMEATGGSELEITGITLDNTGAVVGANGGNVILTGATLRGGTLERTGASAEYATGAVTLHGVTHTGYYRITGGTTTTVMGPVFQNEGEIEVNYSAINAGTYLFFADSTTLQGSGSVELVRPAPYSQLTAAPGALVTQAAGHTIHGRGTIHAALENHGLVRADYSGYALFLATEDKVNRGIMEATGGSELEITGITLDNTGAVVRADGGTVTLAGGTTLRGGTLERTGVSAEYATGAVTLEDLTHTGYYRIQGGTTTTVKGEVFTNDGELEVNYNSINSGTYLLFADSTTLQGGGTVELVRPAPWSQLTAPTGKLVTQAPAHTIHGRGYLRARMRNEGTIRADYGTFALTMDSTLTNAGAVEATGGAIFTLSRPPTNYADSTLTGGAWRALAGTVRLLNMPIRTNAAEIVMEGAASRIYRDAATGDALAPHFRVNDTPGHFILRTGRNLTSPAAFTNRGHMTMGAASTFTTGAGGAYTQTSGTTELAGGGLTAAGGVSILQGSLTGTGLVTGNVAVGGDSLPGAIVSPGASAGTLTITGSYSQTADVTLAVELGGTGPGQSDLLDVGGAATLAGTLALSLLPGFGPDEGDTVEVMRFASRTGVFDAVTGTDAGGGVTLVAEYSDSNVVVVAQGVRTSVESPADPQSPAEPVAAQAPPALRFAGAALGAGEARFELALPSGADVRLTVFDARGRHVATLQDGPLAAGVHGFDFGSRTAGAPLASGIYFARAEVRPPAGRAETLTARTAFVR